MKVFKILGGSAVFIGTVAGIFMLLVRLLSTEERARMVSDFAPIIALIILLLWLAFGWSVESFGKGLAAGLIEGVMAYAIIRVISYHVIDDYRWAEIVAGWGYEHSVDPSTEVVIFMAATAVTIFIGLLVLAAPAGTELDDEDSDHSGGDGSGGSSAALTAATTAAITTTVISTMR